MSHVSHDRAAERPRFRLVGGSGEEEPRRTLRWVYEQVYLPEMAVEVSPAHLVQFQQTLKVWEWFCQVTDRVDCEIDQVRRPLLMEFRAWRIAHGRRGVPGEPATVKPATVNKDLRYLHALVQCAFAAEEIDRPAKAKLLRVASEPAWCWSPEEFAALLGAAGRQTGVICGVPRRAWWWSILSTAYDTGRRRGTLLAASWDWLEEAWLRFPASVQKERKGQAKKLSPDTLAVLAAMRAPPRRLIWPRATKDPRWVVDELRELIRAAGLRQPAKPFHILRSCHATYVKNASSLAAARESLGHSAESVTLLYIDPTKERGTAGCDLMPRGAAMRFAARSDDRQLWLF